MNQILKLLLTFVFIPVITPIYNILDRLIFVKVFGCGCVPSVQSNMFNIAFNANDLRLLVYIILTISMVVLATIVSKAFTKKSFRILYIITVFGLNTYISIVTYRGMMWC